MLQARVKGRIVLLSVGVFLILGLFSVRRTPRHRPRFSAERHAEIQRFFDILRAWEWHWYNRGKIPAEVAALDGKLLTVQGYLYPVASPVDLDTFLLTPHNVAVPQCLFCYRPPRLNEIIEVHLAKGKMNYTIYPVEVKGRFSVGEKKGKEGYTSLYRMFDASARIVGE